MISSCRFLCFKQKTAYEMRISDWSSDVCSSDLTVQLETLRQFGQAFVPGIEHHRFVALARQVLPQLVGGERQDRRDPAHQRFADVEQRRWGARRGGKESVRKCRYRW